MGNHNSVLEDNSTEPRYVDYAPTQRRRSTKAMKMSDTDYEQHGNNKPQVNDEAFSKFIHNAKKKIRSMSNIGHHKNQKRNTAADVANNNVDTKTTNENDADRFSHFIQKTRKKLMSVTTIKKNQTFKKGKDGGY
uniref:Uncharacterized protein LOC101492980 n=1 Tax=Cicer arietinum TaxID=3827 RepID=A0A1S2Y1M4_CICAR|nr:uncharacterized protein LOC101492980 [Cicer arietinum]